MTERSHFTLTTSNGRNVTLVDARSGAVLAFLEHPCRTVAPGPTERDFGVERRNLLAGLDLRVDRRPLAGPVAEAGYVDESGIVRVGFAGGAALTVLAPFGLDLNAALFVLDAPGAAATSATLGFHLGLPPVAERFWESPFGVVRAPGARRLEAAAGGAVIETGPGTGALVHVPLAGTRIAPGAGGGDPVAATGGGRLGFVVAHVADGTRARAALDAVRGWIAGRDAGALIAAELAGWAAWRRPAPARLGSADALAVWRQSEAVLRMGQVRVPGADGMILAALPPGAWSIGWVRDGCYAAVALARAGHHAEARRFLDFMLGNDRVGRYAAHVGGVRYRIALTRYFGDGTEEADWADFASPNIETDGWGLALWAARHYVEASGDLGWLDTEFGGRTVYDILAREVAGAIAAQLEDDPRIMKPDSSIWEVHQERARHFLYTSTAAARGLCDFAWLAARRGRNEDGARWRGLAGAIRAAIPRAFTAVPEGHLLGAAERGPATDIDAAAFEYFTLGVAEDPESPLALRTYAALEALRLPSGGYARSLGPDVYGSSEWAFVNLRAASLAGRRGRHGRARELVDLTTRRAAANFGLIPETYGFGRDDRSEAYSGSVPMVGYGAGLYLLTLIELFGSPTPTSCGA